MSRATKKRQELYRRVLSEYSVDTARHLEQLRREYKAGKISVEVMEYELASIVVTRRGA